MSKNKTRWKNICSRYLNGSVVFLSLLFLSISHVLLNRRVHHFSMPAFFCWVHSRSNTQKRQNQTIAKKENTNEDHCHLNKSRKESHPYIILSISILSSSIFRTTVLIYFWRQGHCAPCAWLETCSPSHNKYGLLGLPLVLSCITIRFKRQSLKHITKNSWRNTFQEWQ